MLVILNHMPGKAAPPPGALSRRVAAVLRGRKGELQVTDQQIGDAVGISQEQVSRFLAPTRVMSIEQTAAICAYLGLDFAAALTGRRVVVDDVHPEDAAIIDAAKELTRRQRKEARRALKDDPFPPRSMGDTATPDDPIASPGAS